MKKHIVFIGKRETGKSLFSRILFNPEKSIIINRIDFDRGKFMYDVGKEDFDFVIIDDLPKIVHFEEFYTLFSNEKLEIKKRSKESIFIEMPTFIFIADSENYLLPTGASFLRRFKVIDFDTATIQDIMKLISEYKLEINFN